MKQKPIKIFGLWDNIEKQWINNSFARTAEEVVVTREKNIVITEKEFGRPCPEDFRIFVYPREIIIN